VIDAELLMEHVVERAPDRVTVGASFNEHVRRENRVSGRQFPQVQIVNFADLRRLCHREPDFVGYDLAGRAFEQHAHRPSLQVEAGSKHEGGDKQRRNRIRSIESRPHDDDTCDECSDERVQIGHDVLEASFDVEALTIGFREDPRSDDVHDDSDAGNGRHEDACYLRGTDETPARFVNDERAEHQQHRSIRLAAQHFGTTHPVREGPAGRSFDEPENRERQHQCAGVRKHVAGVRQEGQRVADDADDDLERHEAENERECDGEVPAVGVRPQVMCVAVAVAMGVTVMMRVLHSARYFKYERTTFTRSAAA